jgi:hypothetical protein
VKRLAFIAVIVLLVVPVHAGAQTAKETTGFDLYNECQLGLKLMTAPTTLSQADLGKVNHCSGYLLGLKDMQTIWNETNKSYNRSDLSLICIPPEATVFELMKVVIKYLDDHPANLHDEKGLVVMKALLVAYPCGKY